MYRRANENDLDWINDVLLESELYWQENRQYEAQLRAEFKIVGRYWSNNRIFIVEKDGVDIGFFGLEGSQLNYLYLAPQYIAKGYSRYLWQAMIDYCQTSGINSITFECSRSVKGFYEHMGAQQIGEIKSYFGKNRMIPKYIYHIPKKA